MYLNSLPYCATAIENGRCTHTHADARLLLCWCRPQPAGQRRRRLRVLCYFSPGHAQRGLAENATRSYRLVVTPAASKTPESEKSFRALGRPSVPTLTPGAMAWPKWHSAELSHRVRIAHHRARHQRAHLPSPLQPHGSSPTALRSQVDSLAHRPLHWKARPILTLCPCVCVSR